MHFKVDGKSACGEEPAFPDFCVSDTTRVSCDGCKATAAFRKAAEAELPAKGTKVFRNATYVGNTCAVSDWEPTKNEHDLYFFRASYTGTFTAKPELHAVAPHYGGVVCFCRDKTIDPWWTHFEIVGYTKKRTGVFVKPVYGDLNELAKTLTESKPYNGAWDRVVFPPSFKQHPTGQKGKTDHA